MDAKMNLYELIGSEPTASISEIKKAYRKKALTCHPDKHPNNPKAAELFHELSKALEILTDEKARASYDQDIAARKRAKKRDSELDAKRRKLKEDLEAREEAYKKTLNRTSDEQRLKAEIERLEKEGSRLVEEEAASVQKKIWERLGVSKDLESNSNKGIFRIKIKWKIQKEDPDNGGYNYNNLYRMFYKYGDIAGLVLSPSRKGRAMIEFEDKSAAETALLVEIGLAQNPLILQGLWTNQKRSKGVFPTGKYPEYESSVLFGMADVKRAEERKRLIEELKAQEEM